MSKSLKTVLARVLAHHPALGLLCGQLVQAPADVVQSLHDAGFVDQHPDAVAYAQSVGAKVVSVVSTDAQELAAAAIEAATATVSAEAADETAGALPPVSVPPASAVAQAEAQAVIQG